MRNILLVILVLHFSVLHAQISCNMGLNKYSFPSEALCTYQFPSDTTKDLITYTYASIGNDTLYYADVLTYKTECASLFFVKVGIKGLKEGFFKIEEILLNEKTKVKGFLLGLYTPVGYNVFITQSMSPKYGSNLVGSNTVNIICDTKKSAEDIVAEIRKVVPLLQVY